MKILLLLTAALVASVVVAQTSIVVQTDPTQFTPFKHFWKESVGSGHALLGTRADWQAQLAQSVHDIGFKRVRMHGIFDDDMSVVLAPGQYEFYNIDVVYDYLLSIGVRPIVELSFMPGVLAGCWPWNATGDKCQYVMHYDGIVQPPANFSDWEDLCFAFATHLVQRYGAQEVRQWHFEVWNELWGMNYPHPYLDLYQASRRGIRRADPLLQVGGPATMQCQWVSQFVQDTNGEFEFVSTHLYPTDPNCTYPAPGYNDADCFANTIKTARAQAPQDKPFFLTEYNAGLFNAELLYSSYAAGFVFRNVPLLQGTLDVWSYWTFSDVFEENGMHSAPFEGFNYGIQTVQGLKKPVYRAFEMLKTAGTLQMPSSILPAVANNSITSFATYNLESKTVSVFVSSFLPQGFPVPTATDVTVTLDSANCSSHIVGQAQVTQVSSGKGHGDVYAAWQQMGSPSYPTPAQMNLLRAASEPETYSLPIQVANGACSVTLTLDGYSIARIDFLTNE
jgi:xylan 1,4-beta-xylosidase